MLQSSKAMLIIIIFKGLCSMPFVRSLIILSNRINHMNKQKVKNIYIYLHTHDCYNNGWRKSSATRMNVIYVWTDKWNV